MRPRRCAQKLAGGRAAGASAHPVGREWSRLAAPGGARVVNASARALPHSRRALARPSALAQVSQRKIRVAHWTAPTAALGAPHVRRKPTPLTACKWAMCLPRNRTMGRGPDRKIKKRAELFRAGVPALSLLHRDLLRDARGVLRIGLCYGAMINGLTAQRTHAFAEVEDVRRRRGPGSVLRRDPVHHVLPVRVRGVLGRISHHTGIPGDVLRLRGDLG